jgi:hypothetical protein
MPHHVNFDLRWARADRAERHGRTIEQARKLWREAAQSGTCCGQCGRALSPTDSVTMQGRIPICLLCTLDAIKLWGRRGGTWYDGPKWRRTRCLNCLRPIRVYPQARNKFSTRPLLSFNSQFCCDDCRRVVKNERNNLRRRVGHEPRACAKCRKSFMPKRADAVTCSGRCRQAMHRERERGSVKHPL